MLQHNSKLKKLWNKCPKRKDKYGCLILDKRYKAHKEFEIELINIVKENVSKSFKKYNLKELLETVETINLIKQ